jgi:hypothetical protein
MARRLAEMQGGTIEASSDGRGRGSRFVLRMPAVDRMRPSATDAVAAPGQSYRRRGRTILLIDDNEDVRRVTHALLALEGHNVRDAPDGLSGVALAAQVKPEVVFADIGRLTSKHEAAAIARAARWRHADRHRGERLRRGKRRCDEAGFDPHRIVCYARRRRHRAIAEMRASSGRSGLSARSACFYRPAFR